jgi:CheY-like chemotaxis protein
MRILIIEDDDNLRRDIAEILELENHEPLTAANGQEGIDTAIQSQPDLIFCDVMMPIMDGIEVLRTIRNNPQIAQIPVILLTGRNVRDLREKIDIDINHILTKPFAHRDMIAMIDSFRPKFTD